MKPKDIHTYPTISVDSPDHIGFHLSKVDRGDAHPFEHIRYRGKLYRRTGEVVVDIAVYELVKKER